MSERADVLTLIADWQRAASPMPMADILRLAFDEIARLRKNADGQIRSRVAEDIAVESAWERCGITPHWPDDEAGSVVSHAESMAMEIARLREERRWVPVSERLPDDLRRVMVMAPGLYGAQVAWLLKGKWHDGIGYPDDAIDCRVTHWMPLPPGPEGK